MDFSYVHIRYFIGYVYHICLQDTIQSTLSLCLLCQAMLLPMPLRPLLLTNAADSADDDGVAADGVDEQGVGELEGCAAELLCVVDVAAGAGLGESNDLRDPCSAVPDVDLGDA